MAAHLRDIRRHQTEVDLQASAVRLVLLHGYDTVTTAMIAAALGMSTRTFFNYYENKDAAIVGPRNSLTPVLIEAFLRGNGAIAEDLRTFVYGHLEKIADLRGLMRDIMRIGDEVLRVRLMQKERGEDIRLALQSALRVRLGPQADLAEYIADLAMSALRQAYLSWLEGEDMSDATETAFDRLARVITVMSPAPSGADVSH